MTNNRKNLLHGECERCGAPLSRAKQKGRFVCKYCGAVYFDNTYSKSEWEEDLEITEPEVNIQTDSIPQTTNSKSKRKINLVKLLGFGVIILICLIGFIIIAFNNSTLMKKSNKVPSINKPEMLSQLPNAVRSGSPLAYGNWELTVSPEILVADNKISFSLVLKNWNNTNQTFRYKPNTIVVYDDLGNKYPIYLDNCEPDSPYLDRQMTFEPYEEIKFQSSGSWCNRNENLPLFFGVIPHNANNLYIHLREFGVFQNITFIFDL